MQLTKHHGLGNDFLVLIDLDDAQQGLPDLARSVCDRRTGVGADGLLRVTAGRDGADVSMELHNADGSRAEMSGNGISCLVQAVVLAGVAAGPEVLVSTDAGPRSVQIEPTGVPATHRVTVDMGVIELGDAAEEWIVDGVSEAQFASAGNPHLVLHAPDEASAPDLVTVGRAANESVPGGVNVEVVRAVAGGLHLDVYERGVGPTRACGTGASAAAAVAQAWGIVDTEVDVTMPGGVAGLQLGESVVMTLPVVAVATVHYPMADRSGGDR